MPDRILRDLTDSEAYNAAPVNARDTFIRLMNKADDYGLLNADVLRLRPLLYPLLLIKVREADLSRWIAECERAGLVRFYTVERREYLQICRWRQRLRNKRAKFPDPPWGLGTHPDDMQPHVIRSADVGHPRTDTESETEKPPSPFPPGFAAFWDAYPAGDRKVARKKCLQKWAKDRLESLAVPILRGLERWKVSKHWADGFVCQPYRFLNEGFWENNPGTSAKDNGFNPRKVTPEDVAVAEGTGDIN